MIADLRERFNFDFEDKHYQEFLRELDRRSGTRVEFRVAETPIFLPKQRLDEIAEAGATMARRLIAWPEYLDGARKSIPEGFRVAGNSERPHFLTADFALVRDPQASPEETGLVPRLVEIQAFPSVFAYQSTLSETYSEMFGLPESLGSYLGGLTKASFWALFKETVLGSHEAENVVLTEVDPLHQKTLPDFLLTAKKLGIPIVDIATLVPVGNKLHYRDAGGRLVPIHRIYNRAIADEMMARKIVLPFDLTGEWDVEWAGHPNWYFLISKYSVPWLAGLARSGQTEADKKIGNYVPPAIFLDEFLDGDGARWLEHHGIANALKAGSGNPYDDLLLKPLFSFAGKGIQFGPTHDELLAIPELERRNYLLQRRMHFVPTIKTPHGMTQAEIRILYLWPDGGELTPAISLVRLGRGKMMGVDHNRNQEWVGGSAAFWRE